MNGTDVFVDTNICIYLLNGDLNVADLLQNQSLYISIITEMELYAYHGSSSLSLQILDDFIQSVSIINIIDTVKIKGIEVRRKSKLKLPDSIIAASALVYNLPLITADIAFKKVENLELFLYKTF
jgi:predicted nucleic acid-binding protein